MSAPNTNLNKQKRRHYGPLLGIVAVLTFVAILFFGYLMYTGEEGQAPQNPDSVVDGRSGEVVPNE